MHNRINKKENSIKKLKQKKSPIILLRFTHVWKNILLLLLYLCYSINFVAGEFSEKNNTRQSIFLPLLILLYAGERFFLTGKAA